MLSLPHLIILFVVALVVFGPQKLPELARMLGRATAEFRRMTSDFRVALEDEVRELDRDARIREVEAAVGAMSRDIPELAAAAPSDDSASSPYAIPDPEPSPSSPTALEENPSDDPRAV